MATDPTDPTDPSGADNADGSAGTPEDIEIALVTMTFDATAEGVDALLANLSKYVVLTRGVDGCRNVDLCTSFTEPTRFVIIEKWESEDLARGHFDSDLMVEMAAACTGLLAHAPAIDLLEGLSAHDLA